MKDVICKRDALNEIIFIVPSSSKVLGQEFLKSHLKKQDILKSVSPFAY